MIFIVRVSDSERLSNSHKIFINVNIFDSLKISDYEKAGMWKQCDGDSADDTPKNLNRTIIELSKLDQEAVRLQNQGLTEDSKEVKQLKYDVICLLKQLSKSLDSQIDALSEMITALRSGYCKYLK